MKTLTKNPNGEILMFTGEFEFEVNGITCRAVWTNGNCNYIEQIEPTPRLDNPFLENWDYGVSSLEEAKEKAEEWVEELLSL